MGLFSKKNKKQGAPAAKSDVWTSWMACSDVVDGDVFDCSGCRFALQVVDTRLSTTTVDMCDQTDKIVKKEKRPSEKVLLKAIKKIPVCYLASVKTKEFTVEWFPMPDSFEGASTTPGSRPITSAKGIGTTPGPRSAARGAACSRARRMRQETPSPSRPAGAFASIRVDASIFCAASLRVLATTTT